MSLSLPQTKNSMLILVQIQTNSDTGITDLNGQEKSLRATVSQSSKNIDTITNLEVLENM